MYPIIVYLTPGSQVGSKKKKNLEKSRINDIRRIKQQSKVKIKMTTSRGLRTSTKDSLTRVSFARMKSADTALNVYRCYKGERFARRDDLWASKAITVLLSLQLSNIRRLLEAWICGVYMQESFYEKND